MPAGATDASYGASSHYAHMVVIILMITTVISYTDRQILSLLVDPIRTELHVDDRQMGYILGGAFALAYGLAGLPMGYIADRWSRRNLILIGSLVWSTATIAQALARNFDELFIARLTVGIGEAVLSPAAVSLLSDYFPPERRGRAVGFYFTGVAVAYGGAILLGGLVLNFVEQGGFSITHSLTSWRLVLLLIGVCSLIWSIVLWTIREPNRSEDNAPQADISGPVWTASVWAMIFPVLMIIAAASMIDNAVGAWAPTHLIRAFHFSAAGIGQILGVLLMFGFGGGMILGGELADFVGRRGGASAKLQVILLAALLVLPVSQSMRASSSVIVLGGVPLFFLLAGIIISHCYTIIVDIVPARQRAFSIAVSFFLNVAIGASVGPAMVAYLADGDRADLGSALATVIAIGGLVMIASVLATLYLFRRSLRICT